MCLQPSAAPTLAVMSEDARAELREEARSSKEAGVEHPGRVSLGSRKKHSFNSSRDAGPGLFSSRPPEERLPDGFRHVLLGNVLQGRCEIKSPDAPPRVRVVGRTTLSFTMQTSLT